MESNFDAEIEPIYELPEEVISQPELRALYRETVQRLHMQALAAGVGDFDLFMLIERYAFRYVALRQKEMNIHGIGGYKGNQEVTMNKLWLDFYREFAIRVTANKSNDEYKTKMMQCIIDTVASQDPSLQKSLGEAFASAFEANGI